jgi:hypothetical protein
MTTPNERLADLAAFTRKHLETSYRKRGDKAQLKRYLSDFNYRWAHTQRVAQFGRIIAEAEGANLEWVVAACILHDISWFDVNGEQNREHGNVGAELIRPFLLDLGYTQKGTENICYSVASHVTVENPKTLEARIVSDADNVDRFGPYRILQWCFSDITDYREKNPLFTETGKQLFAEQLHLQILFFSEFVGERKLTSLPQI